MCVCVCLPVQRGGTHFTQLKRGEVENWKFQFTMTGTLHGNRIRDAVLKLSTWIFYYCVFVHCYCKSLFLSSQASFFTAYSQLHLLHTLDLHQGWSHSNVETRIQGQCKCTQHIYHTDLFNAMTASLCWGVWCQMAVMTQLVRQVWVGPVSRVLARLLKRTTNLSDVITGSLFMLERAQWDLVTVALAGALITLHMVHVSCKN